MRMPMPDTMTPTAQGASKRWPAWPMYAVSSSPCLKVPNCPFLPASERVALRQAHAKPIFDDLEVWLKEQLGMISGKTPLAKAIRYALARMPKARPYLDNGFLELDNNTAERAVRPVTLGRKNYLFMGSEAGGKSAAIAYTLIETAKMNKVNPEAWLAWVLERIQDHPAKRIHDLLPWAYQDIINAAEHDAEVANPA